MKDCAFSLLRRSTLKAGLASASLFFPLPYVQVLAQSEGALKLLRLPKLALVIGNSRYKNVPLLANPANDAKAISEVLRQSGFETVVKLDAGQDEMASTIHAYVQLLAAKKAVGLFYFAGHGVQLAWRNYLIPVDAVVRKLEDVRETCIDLIELVGGIRKASNPMNVVILDACRDNPFGDNVRIETRGLSQMDAPPGTLLAYATAPGNVAGDGEGANGLYTENLLREIRVPETKIEDVFKRVRLHVRRRTNGQQIPWESTSLEEDFYFVPSRQLAAVAEAEAERERKRKEELAALEKLRNTEEEERKRQQELAFKEAQRIAEEVERKRREAQALTEAKRAEEEVERRHKEAVAQRERQPITIGKVDSERLFSQELVIWEKIKNSTTLEPLEDYLLRYPSGRFSELAQLRLDKLLAAQGEKKIETVSDAQNPFSKGSAVSNTHYKVGDRYIYRISDLLTKLVRNQRTETVTAITETEVIYNNGRITTDLLGNHVRENSGRLLTASQYFATEYSAGKKWATRFVLTRLDRSTDDVSLEFKVIGKESITVPAGAFEAWKVEGKGFVRGAGAFWHYLYWMDPGKVRRLIALEYTNRWRGQILNADRFELVAFNQT